MAKIYDKGCFHVYATNEITKDSEGNCFGTVIVKIRRWHPRWWLMTFKSARNAARATGLSPHEWIPLWVTRTVMPRSYESKVESSNNPDS